MILGFKTIWATTKKPTNFVELILSGEKIHTLRKGNRWKAGNMIHMATGVRTKNYKQFNTERADLWYCKSTQAIRLEFDENMSKCKVFVDGRLLSIEEQRKIAINDGFTCIADFWLWFSNNQDDLPDKIIHWTDFKY